MLTKPAVQDIRPLAAKAGRARQHGAGGIISMLSRRDGR